MPEATFSKQSDASAAGAAAARAELEIAEHIGELMRFWGFKRSMGRVWAILYLSPEPCDAAELGQRLQMSAGAVSMTLSELLRWGAIKKIWRPGQRRDFYEAETQIWKLVERVFRERELRMVREFGDSLERAASSLPAASAQPSVSPVEFKRTQIKNLQALTLIGERLLGALVSGQLLSDNPLGHLDAGHHDPGDVDDGRSA